MTKKLFHYRDRAVVRPGDIPNVGVTLGMTLSSREQVQLIIIGDHVVERMVRLVLQPFALASGLQNLVSREYRSLCIHPAVDHVGDVAGLVY